MHPDPAPSLEARRRAIAEALRRVRHEATLDGLTDHVERLTVRLTRLEHGLARVSDSVDEPRPAPLLETGGAYTPEVPPVDLSRRSSPAFDVLLGT